MTVAMLAKFKTALVVLLTALVALVVAYFKGRSSGKEEVKQEVREEHNKAVDEVATQRVENVKVLTDVQKKVINSSDSVVDKELSDKWTRG